jgi:hypothetical protein
MAFVTLPNNDRCTCGIARTPSLSPYPVVIFKANGKTYGLNGYADMWGIADTDLKDIWLKDPKYPDFDLWIPIGAIQNAASQQC